MAERERADNATRLVFLALVFVGMFAGVVVGPKLYIPVVAFLLIVGWLISG